MAEAEFAIQVIVEEDVACPEPEHCHLFPSGSKVVGVSIVVQCVLEPRLAVLLGLVTSAVAAPLSGAWLYRVQCQD